MELHLLLTRNESKNKKQQQQKTKKQTKQIQNKTKKRNSLRFFWAISRMSLHRNSSHYILNTFFYNCQSSTSFLEMLILIYIERLKISWHLRISVVIVNATFCHDIDIARLKQVFLRVSGQYILNKIFHSLDEQFSLLWTPDLAKFTGTRQRY